MVGLPWILLKGISFSDQLSKTNHGEAALDFAERPIFQLSCSSYGRSHPLNSNSKVTPMKTLCPALLGEDVPGLDTELGQVVGLSIP